MTKNRLLNVAISICNLIKAIYILLFIFLTTIFIHFQLNKEYYINKIESSKISFNTKSNGIFFAASTKWKMTGAGEDKEVYKITNIRTSSLYILYFQISGLLIFIFLSTKEFQKIMLSVKNSQTFRRENMLSFKKIGKYIFGFFLLTSYTTVSFEKGGYSGYQISLIPIFLMLIAFIMAEVFKEGNALEQENELTI